MLPSTLRRIAPDAFGHCGCLKSVSLPEGLESIGEGAFRCTRLRVVCIAEGCPVDVGEYVGENVVVRVVGGRK